MRAAVADGFECDGPAFFVQSVWWLIHLLALNFDARAGIGEAVARHIVVSVNGAGFTVKVGSIASECDEVPHGFAAALLKNRIGGKPAGSHRHSFQSRFSMKFLVPAKMKKHWKTTTKRRVQSRV